jgi:hypothetical protein
MRFHLRTLLIVLALGPVMLAGVWYVMNEGRYALGVFVFAVLATLISVIAYWPRICGKGDG